MILSPPFQKNPDFAKRKKTLKNAIEKRLISIEKRVLSLQNKLVNDLLKPLEKRLKLLSQSFHLYKKGAKTLQVPDWNNEGKLETLSLNPEKTLEQEIVETKKKIKKIKIAPPFIKREISHLKEKKDLLNAILNNFENLSIKDLESHEKDFGISYKIIKKVKKKPFRKFMTKQGFLIIAGKKAELNHELTFILSHKNDMWLHAQSYQGCHVIIKHCKGKEWNLDTLYEAAQVAAFYSGGKNEKSVEVLYTERKYVQRTKKMKKGQAIAKNYKILTVSVDKKKIDELRHRAEDFYNAKKNLSLSPKH